MHSLQTLPPPPPECPNFLSRNIKMHLLGVHFGKIHVKLLEQFRYRKKDLQPFKNPSISAADHIEGFWGVPKLLQNPNVHRPLIFCAWASTLLLNITVGFNQKEQHKDQQALSGQSLSPRDRTFCTDGAVPHLPYSSHGRHRWLLSTSSAAGASNEKTSF